MRVEKEVFGKMPDGQAADLYTVVNGNGIKVKLTNLGATLVALEAPDAQGNLADVILGYDTLEGYIKDSAYFGCTVGRFANRIANARFTLDGVEYTLAANDGPNTLHGGKEGFNRKLWDAEPVKGDDVAGVKFSYVSEDGEEGYPGTLTCSVTYTLTNDNELKLSYEAETDKPTVINLTNHAYYNLEGQGTGDILDHEVMICADGYTAADESLIPTGEIAPVKGTPLDFTEPTAIGARIDQTPGGYDNNFVLRNSDGNLALAARVTEPDSGRIMDVHTTEPGIQFYTGNFLDGSIVGKDGNAYKKHYGFCLETQHFPDSPNQPAFPSVVLRPGEVYTHVTVHRFSTKQAPRE